MRQEPKAHAFVNKVCADAAAAGETKWALIKGRITAALHALPDAERQEIEQELVLMLSRDEDQTATPVLN